MRKNTHNFSSAGRIVFGVDAIKDIGTIARSIGGSNILLVCDRGIKQAGILETVKAHITASGLGVQDFADGVPELPLANVEECVRFAKAQGGIDCVVGVGGGSSIDLAKLVACVLRHGGSVRDYLGENKVPGPIVPCIAVPTTAGTGSEVSHLSLVLDTENNTKIGASDDHLRPEVALIDPVLTLGLPARVTAITGIDALCHAIEAFTALPYHCFEVTGPVQFHGSSEITDALAIQAIRLVGRSMRIAVHQGLNLNARVDMAYASLLAGLAFSNSGTGAAHAIGTALGAITHAPHGLLVGIPLPYVLEFNLPVNLEKCKAIAAALGEDVEGMPAQKAAHLAVSAVKQLMSDTCLPMKLEDIGLAEKDISGAAKATLKIQRILRINPRPCDEVSIEGIIRSAW
jgi:alcohol dehydrogenase class IV